VIPALLTRFHAAKLGGRPCVTVLGSGAPRREFLNCDDAAEAAVFLMRSDASLDLVNVGSGEEIAIRDLADRIARVVGYQGEIRFDSSKPDGAPRKLLDSSRILSLGWRPRIAIDAGLAQAYSWYVERFPDGPPLDQRVRAEEGDSFSGYS
jgi:GDP-L-fucose synthase